MRCEKLDYGAFALFGLENVLNRLVPKGQPLAICCHKGMRRSQAAVRLLMNMRCIAMIHIVFRQ